MENSLRSLSNVDLVASLKQLRSREKDLLVDLLEHIQEVDRRKLYLPAYTSLYKYLIGEMGYTESEAFCRIEAARFIQQVPSAKEEIQAGSLTLTAVTELRGAIRRYEKDSGIKVDQAAKAELVDEIKNSTRIEVQKKLATHFGKDSVSFDEKLRPTRDGHWLLQVILNSDQRFCLDRAKDILAHKGPMKGYSEVISRLADQFLKRRDFSLTTQSFVASNEMSRHNTSAPVSISPTATEAIESTNPSSDPNSHLSLNPDQAPQAFSNTPPISTVTTNPVAAPKRISMALRRAVFRRDQGMCQYRIAQGKICGDRHQVELDHILPLSKGGENLYENLRCVCRAHNNWRGNRQPTEPA